MLLFNGVGYFEPNAISDFSVSIIFFLFFTLKCLNRFDALLLISYAWNLDGSPRLYDTNFETSPLLANSFYYFDSRILLLFFINILYTEVFGASMSWSNPRESSRKLCLAGDGFLSYKFYLIYFKWSDNCPSSLSPTTKLVLADLSVSLMSI